MLKLLDEVNVAADKEEENILLNKINCTNPRCISSVEQELDSIFKLTDEKSGVYRCIYCECQAIVKENE
ncbi:MAG: hypothetical protein UHH95_06275 [Oscillospiraceae bacterium]|nr:hypothetical protein [Oscillospiraceae bacterium]